MRKTGSTAPRERRQSPRMTKRELRQTLSGGGRKWIKQVWQAGERYTLRLSSLSPVTGPLAAKLIDEFMAELNLAGEETHRAFFLTLVAGYSARVVVADPTEQPGLRRVVREDDKLEDEVRTIAAERFASVMTLPPEVWNAFEATATMKQQSWLTSRKLPWYVLGRERARTLLRWGYVLRCVDEALDAEPALQSAADSVRSG
jgi:hypothetical protein